MRARRPRNSRSPARYRAGAAARLAGLRVDTLRAWERRYGAVAPEASTGGHRLYSPEDVARLALLKRVVDLGHAIGSVARLSQSALRGVLDSSAVPERGSITGPAVRVAAVGASLAAQLDARSQPLPGVEVLAAGADLATTQTGLRGRRVDCAIVDLSLLDADATSTADALATALGVRTLVVLYRFGPQAVVRALRARGHLVAHAPVDDVQLAALCVQATPSAHRGDAQTRGLLLADPPPPRFSDVTLARLAQSSANLLCECPRHVSELLVSLAAFESYSAQCEARHPGDAALHDHLRRAAGTARRAMEEALVKLAEAEGLELGESASAPTAAVPPRRKQAV